MTCTYARARVREHPPCKFTMTHSYHHIVLTGTNRLLGSPRDHLSGNHLTVASYPAVAFAINAVSIAARGDGSFVC